MRLRRVLLILLVIGLLLAVVVSRVYTPTELPQEEKFIREPSYQYITLVSVGDIMMHNTQIADGYEAATDSYQFDHFFSDISPYWEDADFVVGNLETVLAGEAERFTGYPMFNSPDELAEALVKAGFDLVSTANNHSLDRFERGLRRTLDVLDEAGLIFTGTARSEEERKAVPIVDIEGIKCAFLAYTYGTNGIPIPRGHEYLVNMIDAPLMKGDIARVREQGAEVIVVSPHFGREYRSSPDAYQIQTVNTLVKAGADVILGSHPHVLQPFEFVEAKTGEGTTNKAAVLYSQGNFISAQKGLERETSALFFITIEKELWEQEIQVTNIEYLPIYTHKYREGGKLRYRVVPIEASLALYEAGERGRFTSEDYRILQKAYDHAVGALGEEGLIKTE